MHRISSDFLVAAPLEKVWDFSINAENLSKVSPPKYRLKVFHTGTLNDGSIVKIRTRMPPLPIETLVLSKVEGINAQGDLRSFRDKQIEGPFKYWSHEHIFERDPKGTWIRDRVDYALPLGILGVWANSLVVKRSLEQMFAFRKNEFEKIFGIPQK